MNQDTAKDDPKTEGEAIEEQIVSAQPATEIKTPSNRNKIIIIVLVVAALTSLAAYIFLTNPGNILNLGQKQTASVPAPQAEGIISDTQLETSVNSINSKMTNLDTDFNNIDYGLNDKTVDGE